MPLSIRCTNWHTLGMFKTGTRKWYGEISSRHLWTHLHSNGSRNSRPQKIPGLHGNSWWKNVRNKMQITSGYLLQLEFSPSAQTTGKYSKAIRTDIKTTKQFDIIIKSATNGLISVEWIFLIKKITCGFYLNVNPPSLKNLFNFSYSFPAPLL